MRKVLLLLFLLVVLGVAVFIRFQEAPEIHYPFDRTVVDKQGRSLPVAVLAKRSDNLVVRRKVDNQVFMLPLNTLNRSEKAFFGQLEDGGDYSVHERQIRRKKMTQGRVAAWHRDLENAKREAEKIGIPIVVAFLHSRDKASRDFDQGLLRSKVFREWANQNVVLCLYYNDPPISSSGEKSAGGPSEPPKIHIDSLQTATGLQPTTSLGTSGGLNGGTVRDGRHIGREYGVSTAPTLLYLKAGGSPIGTYSPNSRETPRSLINRIDATLYPVDETAISSVETPESFGYRAKEFLLGLFKRSR